MRGAVWAALEAWAGSRGAHGAGSGRTVMIFDDVARPGQGRARGGRPHRQDDTVSRRSQYRTIKSAYCEHSARGLDGRIEELADLMFGAGTDSRRAMSGSGRGPLLRIWIVWRRGRVEASGVACSERRRKQLVGLKEIKTPCG